MASNEIQEFSLGSNLFNLRLLNLSINRIKTITNLHKIKSLSELYAGYNCLQNLNTLCKLEKLKILDIQHNNITSFEEIAILSVNPKLTTLAIKGNPIESRLNFLSTLKSILPKIYNLNPISIFEYSDFKDFGYMPFIPLKKPPEQVKQYRSLGPEEVSGSSKVRKPSKAFTPSKDRSVSLSLNNSRVQDNLSSLTERTRISQTPQKQHNQDKSEFLIKIQDNPLQFTPEIIDKQAKKKRSQSVTKLPTSNDAQTAPENFQKVGTVSKLLESSKNKSKEDAYEAAMSFIMQAESRIKKEPHDISQNFEKTGLHHVVSMPTMSFKHEEGIRPVKINYGNPEAAIMIGPPAIKSQQRIKAPETYQRLEFNNRRKESADV